MARTVRNAKLDTRSARARLPAKKSGYWVPIARGFALGYRKGPKGSVWLARLIDSRGRRETSLGSADDALDADGERILDYTQAQAKARNWLASLDAESKPGPYTIDRCLDDYIADYKRRGGKALDRLEITADAFIRPQLGTHEVDSLKPAMIREWHAALAEAPARLRTRKTAERRNVREIDLENPDAVRQRRASANRILGVLKAALNLAFREGHAASDEAWRRVKPFREASAPKISYLSHAEAQRLVNACEPGFRPLVQCALLTGCRYGEIVGFRVGDFNRDAGTVSVHASKAGRPRHVVLTDDGIALFEQHVAGKPGTASVFTRSDGMPMGKVAPAPAPARSLPPRRDRSAGQLSHFASHLCHASVAGWGTVAGDRSQSRPFGHAHDRAALCPSRPVARCPGDPRDHAKARARRAEPGDVMITPAVDRLSRDTSDLLVIAREMQRAGTFARRIVSRRHI